MSKYSPKRGKCSIKSCKNQKNDSTYYCNFHYDRIKCKMPNCAKTIGEDINGLLCKNHKRHAVQWGWSEEEFLLKKGQNRCDLCGVESDKLYVDHDHDCCPIGKGCKFCYRGMLCVNCNPGLGHFKDDPILLIKAIGYVKRVRPGHFKDYT